MGQRKNWVDKSAKSSYHDNTTVNKKIMPKILFKILKGDFSQKIVRFLKLLFFPFKRGL